MKGVLRTTLVSIFAISISACSVIPEPEQVRVYPLRVEPVTASEQTFSGTLRVAEPTSLSALDTPRIAVYQADGRQAYWQGVRLQDRVPLVVQDHVLRMLQESRIVQHVIDDRSGSAHHFELQTHIEAFGIQSGPPKAATVVLRTQLRNAHDRQVVATRSFSVQSEVAPEQASSQLTALELQALSRSLQAVQQEMITWLVQHLSNQAAEIN